ncbi:MAG: ABC transporter permease [Planctomycetaceae bacterium]|nr:ABC transporter permease [Planctomycetaceae bacterium]
MLSFAFANLCSRPLRTTLSVLGLMVSIAGMVGLFSIAEGIDRVVSKTFQQIPGLLIQQRGAPVPIFSTLPAVWQQELQELPAVSVVNASVFSRINLLNDKVVLSPPRFVLGTDIASRLALKRCVYQENLVAGRFLTPDDVGTHHCVLSRQIAEERDCGVGETIDINRVACEVVGIYHTGSLMIDVSILMDIGTARSMSRIDEGTVNCFYVEVRDDVANPAAKQQIEAAFLGRDGEMWTSSASRSSGNLIGDVIRSIDRTIRGEGGGSIGPGRTPPAATTRDNAESTGDSTSTEQTSPIEVRTAEDWSERFDEFSADLRLFLVIMTTIGVTIAVLSILNTMLMSITERTIDFGILRANGWRTRDIISLITWESALIGVLGGVLGTGIGWLATLGINAAWPDRMQLFASPQLILFSLLFSIVLGIAGGVYPAWLASRLSPMDAIRRG